MRSPARRGADEGAHLPSDTGRSAPYSPLSQANPKGAAKRAFGSLVVAMIFGLTVGTTVSSFIVNVWQGSQIRDLRERIEQIEGRP